MAERGINQMEKIGDIEASRSPFENYEKIGVDEDSTRLNQRDTAVEDDETSAAPGLPPTSLSEFPDGKTTIFLQEYLALTLLGGMDAWLTVVGGFFCLFCSFGTTHSITWHSADGKTLGFINAVGVFQTYYEQNQLRDHTPFQIGWLLSFLVFCMNMGVCR